VTKASLGKATCEEEGIFGALKGKEQVERGDSKSGGGGGKGRTGISSTAGEREKWTSLRPFRGGKGLFFFCHRRGDKKASSRRGAGKHEKGRNVPRQPKKKPFPPT